MWQSKIVEQIVREVELRILNLELKPERMKHEYEFQNLLKSL